MQSQSARGHCKKHIKRRFRGVSTRSQGVSSRLKASKTFGRTNMWPSQTNTISCKKPWPEAHTGRIGDSDACARLAEDNFAEDTQWHCQGISMCLEHASRRLKDLKSLGHYLSICIRRRSTFSFPFVPHCVHVSQTRLKASQGLASSSSSAQEPISNGVQFGELKAIGTHRRWGYLQICTRRRSTFSFPSFFPALSPSVREEMLGNGFLTSAKRYYYQRAAWECTCTVCAYVCVRGYAS